MSYNEAQYLRLMRKVLNNGIETDDRTGTGTYSLFGAQLRFNMDEGFPLLTTKKMFTKGIIHELLWFISGSTNIKYLQENGVHIWDEWADKNGNLGPVYGAQWRNYVGIRKENYGDGTFNYIDTYNDQLAEVIKQIKYNPNSRRIMISSWNVPQINDMALPPCHCLMQFKVYDDTLHLQLYQRSADLFLGVPFNIASYSLLLHMVAQVTGLKAGTFVHTFGDVHIYKNHVEQCYEQLMRDRYKLPTLSLNPEIKNIDDFKFNDIQINNYKSHPLIKAPISV